MKKIIWTVIHGEKLWRKLGFPTANIAYNKADIPDSVFHLNIIIDGKIHEWMWSYMVKKNVFEAHIFNFNQNIYDKEIEVILLKQIRDNIKFNSLDELIDQIQKDQEYIQKQKLTVLTFWSFDYVHDGHKHYLWEAKKYWNNLVTIVATDANIERIKSKAPLHSTPQRVESVSQLWISDQVIPGSEENPMKWLEEYKPHAICLGYDQRGNFVDSLPEKLKEFSLDTQIIHIWSFKPEIYKSSLLKEKRES